MKKTFYIILYSAENQLYVVKRARLEAGFVFYEAMRT